MNSKERRISDDTTIREIISLESQSEGYSELLDRIKMVGERVLWLCSTKADTRRQRTLLSGDGLSASLLDVQPVLESRGTVTLTTYRHASSVLRHQVGSLLLDPSDYAMTVFDNAEAVSPTVHRELLGRLASRSVVFVAGQDMNGSRLAFLKSLLNGEDSQTKSDWKSTLHGDGWLEWAACRLEDATMAECGCHNVTAEMRELCGGCPVKNDCLAMCLKTEQSDRYNLGFAGGLTKADRDAVRTLLAEGRELEAAAVIEYARR